MEVLACFGSPQQQEQWLQPLLKGEIRSGFAMTEPSVASSDGANLECRADISSSNVVLNGVKWFTSGAMDPRCQVLIVMARNDFSESSPKHLRHCMVLVPMSTPGVQIVRHLNLYGYDDAPHGHAEISFRNVTVPIGNLIQGPGDGFAIAQGRLGPGRIHHCARLVGMGERAIHETVGRMYMRAAFGSQFSSMTSVLQRLASMRSNVQQARLLVLQCATQIDQFGPKGARQSISLIKAAVPSLIEAVIDQAIQIQGGRGVCQDTVLPQLWAGARALRLADGPDEVHLASVGSIELVQHKL